MTSHMSLQIDLCTKTFVANTAGERLFPCMASHVGMQISFAAKSFITHCTTEWPLMGVGFTMIHSALIHQCVSCLLTIIITIFSL